MVSGGNEREAEGGWEVHLSFLKIVLNHGGSIFFPILSLADSRVFVDLVTAIIKPILFGATEVGYTFDLTSTPRGIELSFGGLSDHVILQHIINITMYSKSAVSCSFFLLNEISLFL